MTRAANIKRILIYVTCSVLSFNFGLVAEALLAGRRPPAETPRPAEVVSIPAEETDEVDAAPTPEPEIVFGGGRLKLVPDEVQLNSDRFHYQIKVTYPQVVGSDEAHIRRLNQHIKQLVTEQYRWPLTITEEELRHSLEVHPEVYNTVDINYSVEFAGDSMVSIFFGEYSYGIGAAHAVEQSFVVNYDLARGKELKLSDLFAPGSKYQDLIENYCVAQLKRSDGLEPFPDSFAPGSGNLKSWTVTPTGISFHFDSCSIAGCSSGPFEVEIPYSDLKPMLSSRAMSILPISSVVKVKADHK